ncbi:MAG: hypothetical protein KA264_05950 [Crocinitomicaceae bacterium]|jgi:hypothetical protein|nr:hypothetical protein [Crocinitomicaceae bacterium]
MELTKEENKSWSIIVFIQHKILMLITHQIGGLPEFEKINLEDEIVVKPIKKNNTKRNKILKYSIFPIVILLITIDEAYIRIKDFITNFTISD